MRLVALIYSRKFAPTPDPPRVARPRANGAGFVETNLKIVSNRLPLPKVSPAIEEEEKGRAVPRGFRFQGESQQWREITFRSDLVVCLFRNLFHV